MCIWKKENYDILSNESEITVHSQDKTVNTFLNQTTIKLASQVVHDETMPSYKSTITIDKPSTNVTTNEDEVKIFTRNSLPKFNTLSI